jgi:hypothetical protein
MAEQFALAKAISSEPGAYRAAIVDWVANSASSPYALSADEVVARTGGRSRKHGEAAACFEIGQYLFEHVSHAAAQPWWKRARELHPEHWTYKRQAWALVTTPDWQPSDLMQGPNDIYVGNWVDDVDDVKAAAAARTTTQPCSRSSVLTPHGGLLHGDMGPQCSAGANLS